MNDYRYENDRIPKVVHVTTEYYETDDGHRYYFEIPYAKKSVPKPEELTEHIRENYYKFKDIASGQDEEVHD